MTKLTWTACGVVALLGCGPDLDEQTPTPRSAQTTQAIERPAPKQGSDTSERLTAAEVFKGPAEPSKSPEAPTFETTFIYLTPITR